MKHRNPSFVLAVSVGGLLLFTPRGETAPPGALATTMHVDQFGYLPAATKIAVLADPQIGFNSGQSYTPASLIELRNLDTDNVIFSAAPTAWNSGETHDQSGDRVWWFDFSSVTTWGNYYLYDPSSSIHSPPFRIHPEVYQQAIKDAVRTFFYQRSGFAKQAPYADARWSDAGSHLGALQDLNCRSISAQNDATTERNLSGGWYDAGDFNKYVNFSMTPVLQLLDAYRSKPSFWQRLRLDIPESDSSPLPDLLDEIKWELDWLLRMQNANGSVLGKVAVTNFQSASPPSSDNAPRYYGPVSTTSTLSAAAMFALGASAFKEAGDISYATTLRNAAITAWDWAELNPSVAFDNSGFSSADPEDTAHGLAYGILSRKLTAAVYLYEATNDARYKNVVESEYTGSHLYQWWYVYPFESAIQDALLHFTTLPGVNSTVRDTILGRKQSSIGNTDSLPPFISQTDAYRAYLKEADYGWGSNQTKANMGLIFHWQNRLNLDPAQATSYRDASAGFLHYLHGTNPLGMVMMTNMAHAGATRSANEIYHGWFGDGTIYDNALTSSNGPAPGYIPGGANPNFSPEVGVYTGPPLDPPMNQPTQKSYLDWNTSYPENSWQVTEPAIYYQAAYIRLATVQADTVSYTAWATNYQIQGESPQADSDHDELPNLIEYAVNTLPNTNQSSPLQLTSSGNNSVFSFPYQPRADLELVIETSSDLNSPWTPLATLAAGSPTWSALPSSNVSLSTNNGTTTATITYTSPTRFFRLSATLIPM